MQKWFHDTINYRFFWWPKIALPAMMDVMETRKSATAQA
jgi:hypothetical protein